jgi:menaquinone-dependent protoporphyrinogen oxidase
MSDILVLFGSDSATSQIADRIADRLRELGHRAVALRASGDTPPAAKFDAVVVGSPVRLGRHPREIVDYVTTNREALMTKPNAYFSVSSTSHRPYAETPTFEEKFFQTVHWKPHHAASFASTLRGRFYTWALQRLLARMDKATDWDAVGQFADRLDRVVTDAVARS